MSVGRMNHLGRDARDGHVRERAAAAALAMAEAPAPAPLPIRQPRPASAPQQRPRVTVPRPFSFEGRQPRVTTSMRKMQQDLEAQQTALEDARKNLKARPIPPDPMAAPEGGRQPLYPEDGGPAAAPAPVKTVTKPAPFNFAARPPKKASAPEEKPPPPFTARSIPVSMNEPRWQQMQVTRVVR